MGKCKRNFFQNEIEAILFMIFVIGPPLASLIVTFMLNDRTMYVILYITIIGFCYNYIDCLFENYIGKRIFIEASVLSILWIISTVLCSMKTIFILSKYTESYKYEYGDFFLFMGLLIVPIVIYVLETVIAFVNAYKKKVIVDDEYVGVGGISQASYKV